MPRHHNIADPHAQSLFISHSIKGAIPKERNGLGQCGVGNTVAAECVSKLSSLLISAFVSHVAMATAWGRRLDYS